MTETASPAPTPTSSEMFVVDTSYECANWRPLVNWILYIPHGIILYGLRILASVVGFIYWLVLLFTGKLNPGLYSIMTMYERYNARASAFLFGYSQDYAPFDFNGGPEDNSAYGQIGLSLPVPPETTSRVAALNFLLAIPHYIVLFFFFIGASVVAFIGWFAVLFTGAWPKGMRDFLVKVSNYYYRVWVYVIMVETNYPKFGIS
jgi:hypothetical protein